MNSAPQKNAPGRARLLPSRLALIFSSLAFAFLSHAASLPQQAYLWQRAWTPAVIDSALTHANSFSELVLLSGEVSWNHARPIWTPAAIRWDIARQLKTPLGLALRIDPFPGPFSTQDETASTLAALAASIIHAAQANGINPRELQIDFDCAASKLAGYAAWVRAFQPAIAPIPIVITALPSWLDQPAFHDLASACGAYVLQVHSLHRPRSYDAPFTLCDTDEARAAVQRASSLGIPFRVALPTYAYVLAFAPDGQFAGLSAEGPAKTWPANARLREVWADPIALAPLVQQWSAQPPSAMRGVIWYRLPNDSDTLNWRWPTLDAMVHLRSPRESFHAEARRVEAGLYDISLVNHGELDVSSRLAVEVHWQGARLAAGDALRGFELADSSPFSAKFTSANPPRLRAGSQCPIGWIRLTKDAEVTLETTKP